MLQADVAFGVEEIDVAGTVKTVDICGLADQVYDAIKQLPEATTELDVVASEAAALNSVLVANGFPAIESKGAAYKFCQDILLRAIEVKKNALAGWSTGDEQI